MDNNLIEESSGFQNFDNEPKQEKALFILLGNASLLALNILFNAVDIYVKLTGRSGGVIATNLNRAYNIPCSIAALVLCFLKPKNLKLTIIVSLAIVIILTLILPIFLLANMSQDAIYWGTMVIVAIIGTFSSAIFSTTFSFAAQYREDSVGFVSFGNGLCGLIAAGMRIFTKVINDTAGLNSAYFFLADAIFAATLVYFIFKARDPTISSKLVISEEEQKQEEKSASNTKKVIKAIWPQWVSVFLNYCITLSLFPGYMANTNAGKLASWSYIIITSIFAIFDWVGRALPSYVPMIVSLKWSWIPIVVRLLFYLIFMLSIQGVANLGDPWWTYSWDIVFALTNGYFGTICMVYGNTHPDLTENDDKRFAGFLMPFACNAGILAAMGVTFLLPTK